MNFVSRAQWGARAPKRVTRGDMSQPSSAHWNGPTITVKGRTTWDHAYCAGLVRGIQNFHMDGRGWNDIAYNFLECPHGYTFEGRGLNVWNGANGTNAGNRSSHAICSLAGQGNPHSNDEKHGFRACVKHIADHTKAPNRCIGHRDHKATECPGNARYAWVHAGMPVSGAPPVGGGGGGGTLLRNGDRGAAVKEWQEILIAAKVLGGGENDGVFGPNTELATKRFQRQLGVADDGIVGPATRDAFARLIAYVESQKPKPPAPKAPPFPGGGYLKEGSRGDGVRTVQDRLNKAASQGVTVDGIFGPATKRAVINVQRFFGVNADGIVGPVTWGLLWLAP